jgi:hypothetical protein
VCLGLEENMRRGAWGDFSPWPRCSLLAECHVRIFLQATHLAPWRPLDGDLVAPSTCCRHCQAPHPLEEGGPRASHAVCFPIESLAPEKESGHGDRDIRQCP